MAGIGDHAPGLHAREAPAVAGNHLHRTVEEVTHDEDGLRLVQIRRGIGLMRTVREEEMRHVHRSLELHVHAPGEAPAIDVERLRGLETHQPPDLGREVTLPAARGDDPAAAHQPAVACVHRRMRVAVRPEDRPGGVIEVRDGDLVASIDDVEDESAADLRPIDRGQDGNVRDEGDAARLVSRRQRDVGDGLVRRVLRVDREVKPARQLLVGTDVTEGAPARQGRRSITSKRVTGTDPHPV